MKRAIGSVLVGYGLWGLLPMFWKQFHTLDAVYLLAVRIVMSMVFCLLLVGVTRRFDALKVYISFRMRGRDGFGRIIDTAVDNASYFYSRLSADDEFIAPVEPELSSVVFAHRGGDETNRRVRRSLLESGTVIGQTVYDGRVMLKFTLLNPALTHEHIDSLIDRIKDLAAAM